MLKKNQEKIGFVIGLIFEIRAEHPNMGLRSIHEMAKPEGIGRDVFIQIGVNAGLVIEPVKTAPRTTFAHPSARFHNLLKGVMFTDVNQVWSSDITYFKIGDKWYYIVFIMDIYSRKIIGYSASDNMRASNNVNALKMAFKTRSVKHFHSKLIHHSDRGSQYISDDYLDLLTTYGVQVSMCSNVLENAHIERVNGTIKNYYLKHMEINNLSDLEKKLNRAVNAYNNRPHQSLNKKSPNEFEQLIINIPIENREGLEIFCYNQNNETKNPNQLSLDFN